MPLPVPNLDDRRFDDLVAEAKARLATHLPELTQIAPGDPVHSFVDLFAWLTETILYRANLIPERQRRVFLNLLQIPLRPARAARGVVCVDASPTSVLLPPLLTDGTQLKAGKQTLTAVGELQPTCVGLQVVIKKKMTATDLQAMGLTLQDLSEQFGLRKGETPTPFQPHRFDPVKETMTLTGSLDNAFYLACIVPRQLESNLALVRQHLAGVILNIGIAPADALEGDSIHELAPRKLVWELASTGEEGEPIYLPLDVLADSSNGGRQTGVVRLRLPKNSSLFQGFAATDPMFSGVGEQPPELADQVDAARVALWLRLRCPEHPDLQLGYLGLNAVDVLAQGLTQDRIVGMGTGQPDQVVALPDRQIDANTLQLDVEENGAWVRWQRVDFLAGQDAQAKVYTLDAQNGYVYFGDGVTAGRRPPQGARIRAAAYLFGGGTSGNLPAGTVKEIVNGSPRHKLRHEWPLTGGLDAETVEQAEKRIPQFLTHRNRAVTKEDFKLLTEANPVNPVARAEVRVGFLPGARIQAAREDVPGAVSVFVLPPGTPALGHTPKPTQGLLKDVFGYLLNRVLIGTELYVLSPQFVPVAVSVKVQVRDAETEQQTLRDVQYALVDYLWPLAPGGARATGWPMGASVRANELITQVARIDGVLAVNKLSLFIKGAKGWRRLGENEEVQLKHYQLPELLGVRAETGTGAPALPDGIGTLEGQATTSTSRGVPVPVIPDVC
ncbi:MAG: putative baseplate assembly protein [Pseudomonadota bacterium]